jgi:hypothetical protein
MALTYTGENVGSLSTFWAMCVRLASSVPRWHTALLLVARSSVMTRDLAGMHKHYLQASGYSR